MGSAYPQLTEFTFQECRKLRIYGSPIAIGIALHSSPIERLKRTKPDLTPAMKHKLDGLEDVFQIIVAITAS